MHIGNNSSEPMSYKLKPDISGMDITTSEKDVGVIIDSKLSFDTHIAEKVNYTPIPLQQECTTNPQCRPHFPNRKGS